MNADEILALLKINELAGRMPGYAHFASAAHAALVKARLKDEKEEKDDRQRRDRCA
jgi:hypothetical protein